MADSVKRKAFSIEDKVKIIRCIECGANQSAICKEFSLSKSTVSNIWKNRSMIISAHEKNLDGAKKLRRAEKENVEEALLKWFTIQRNRNLPVTGVMLQNKANEFAERFEEKGFVCSNGWLDRFKKRNNISGAKVVGEASSVTESVVENWKTKVWPDVIQNYEEKDIFNADEAGLFYKMTPNQTLKFKGEKCSGGKLSKVRVTVLVCANMDGSEKRKLTVIGNSQKPRCFKNVKKLPVNYKANRKSWMTADLFEEELRQWDSDLLTTKRKIVLLIDNCTAHPHLKNLRCIKLVFLPPSTTSVLQPMDQGVIRSLKAHYRKQLVLRILESYEKGSEYNVSILEAIVLLEKSWRRVTAATIRNCFRHAGLCKNVLENIVDDVQDDENLPLKIWLEKHNVNLFPREEIEHFETIDSEVITSDIMTDDDIVSELKEKNDANEDDFLPSDESEMSAPSISDVKAATNILSTFFSTENVDKKTMDAFLIVDKKIDELYLKSKCVQTKITSFFQRM